MLLYISFRIDDSLRGRIPASAGYTGPTQAARGAVKRFSLQNYSNSAKKTSGAAGSVFAIVAQDAAVGVEYLAL